MFSGSNDDFKAELEILKLCLTSDKDLDELMDDLEQRRYGTKEEFDILLKEREKLEREVQEYDDEISKIENFPKTIQSYEVDSNKFDAYIENMEKYILSNSESLKQLSTELTKMNDEIRSHEEKKRNLEDVVKEQEFGMDEVVWARDRQKQLDDEIYSEKDAIEDLKKNIRMLKLESTKFDDVLKRIHIDANTWMSSLQDLIVSPGISCYVGPLVEILQRAESQDLCRFFASGHDGEIVTCKEERESFSKFVHDVKMAVVEQMSALKGSVKTTEQQKLDELDVDMETAENRARSLLEKADEFKVQLDSERKVSEPQIMRNNQSSLYI